MGNADVHALAVDHFNPTQPKRWYAWLVDKGLFRSLGDLDRKDAFKSTDGGESWIRLNTAPKDVAAIAIHPMKPEVVFLGTVLGKIFKSLDGGQTWRRQS